MAGTRATKTFIILYSDSAEIVHLVHRGANESAKLRLPRSCVTSSLVALDHRTGRVVKFEYISPFIVADAINGPQKPLGQVQNKTGSWRGVLLAMEGDSITLKVQGTNQIVCVVGVTSVSLENTLANKDNNTFLHPHVAIPEGASDVELGYLMSQINWRAYATARLVDGGKNLALRFAAHVQNDSGFSLRGNLKLLAGQPSQPSQYYAPRPVMMMARKATLARLPAASSYESDQSGDANMPSQVEDYKYFSIGDQDLSETMVVIELFQDTFPVIKFYLHDVRTERSVNVAYRFFPKRFLPQCTLRLFSESKDGLQLGEFLGETRLSEKQEKDKAEPVFGASSMVEIESDVTETQSSSGDMYKQMVTSTIINKNDHEVEVVLRLDVGGLDVASVSDVTFIDQRVTFVREGSVLRFVLAVRPSQRDVKNRFIKQTFSATVNIRKPPRVY